LRDRVSALGDEDPLLADFLRNYGDIVQRDRQSLEDRLQDGLRHAQTLGAEGAEAYVSVSRSRRAKVQNGALEDLTTSKRGGLGVRVLRRGARGVRTGIAKLKVGYNRVFGYYLEISRGQSDSVPADWLCRSPRRGNAA